MNWEEKLEHQRQMNANINLIMETIAVTFTDKYDDMVNVKGGWLHKQMSIDDPNGRFFAQCSSHRQFFQRIDFNYDPFDPRTDRALIDGAVRTAEAIIAGCPYCKAID